jgi:hypothetical protein
MACSGTASLFLLSLSPVFHIRFIERINAEASLARAVGALASNPGLELNILCTVSFIPEKVWDRTIEL